jgi:hypothetical protein
MGTVSVDLEIVLYWFKILILNEYLDIFCHRAFGHIFNVAAFNTHQVMVVFTNGNFVSGFAVSESSTVY